MAHPYAASLERLGEAFDTPKANRQRMLVIVNPYATTMSERLKHLVVYALQGRFDVEAIDTQRKGHAIELCREAAGEGYDVVVAFGGDGTVNEAANGLVGSATPLTTLPGGSANVYGRMLGIPNDVVDATEHLLRLADVWSPRSVDVGLVNSRAFTFSAGVGLDASVVERVDRRPRLKARFGAFFFTATAVTTFASRYLTRPPRMLVDTGTGEPVAGITTLVQNADPYTYFRSRPIAIAEPNTLDSGELTGVVLERGSPIDMPTVLARAFTPRLRVSKHRRVAAFGPTDGVVVRSADDRPLPYQVDGDHVGEDDELRFEIAPKSLRVVA